MFVVASFSINEKIVILIEYCDNQPSNFSTLPIVILLSTNVGEDIWWNLFFTFVTYELDYIKEMLYLLGMYEFKYHFSCVLLSIWHVIKHCFGSKEITQATNLCGKNTFFCRVITLQFTILIKNKFTSNVKLCVYTLLWVSKRNFSQMNNMIFEPNPII